jgi:hypothetical protein
MVASSMIARVAFRALAVSLVLGAMALGFHGCPWDPWNQPICYGPYCSGGFDSGPGPVWEDGVLDVFVGIVEVEEPTPCPDYAGCIFETFLSPMRVVDPWRGTLESDWFVFVYWGGTSWENDRFMALLMDYGVSFPIRMLVIRNELRSDPDGGILLCGLLPGDPFILSGTTHFTYLLDPDGEHVVRMGCLISNYCLGGPNQGPGCSVGDEFRQRVQASDYCRPTLARARQEYDAIVDGGLLRVGAAPFSVVDECSYHDPCRFPTPDAGCPTTCARPCSP